MYERRATPGCVKEGYLFKKSSSKMLQVSIFTRPDPHALKAVLTNSTSPPAGGTCCCMYTTNSEEVQLFSQRTHAALSLWSHAQ